jgi:benzoate/toluate 1,2-dioxygenase beta subunit/anthranilate 1,2-dioxygenase (deaminating, decarboxylating) small subunit
MSATSGMTHSEALEIARGLLAREAASLDERRWDDWLSLFAPDCEYWVPTWRTEDALTANPQAEISHIYYASRAGLEDRIVRIRSGRSPASTPLRRTTHMVSNILVLAQNEGFIQVRSSWTSQVFDPRHKKSDAFFGHALYELRTEDGAWRIARKKTVLQNDYLPSMVDVYCI